MKTTKELSPHVGIFGRRNNGKSSIINKITGQDIAIVDSVAGTTTDPVKKSFELTSFGSVVLIDTAGVDDVGELGKKRVKKTHAIIEQIDLAALVISENKFGEFETELIESFKSKKVPFFIIHNKSDLTDINDETKAKIEKFTSDIVSFSVVSGDADSILEKFKKLMPSIRKPSMIGDLVDYGDIVLLITPIDIEAPAGRMILPQVQAIRDILDNDCVAIVLKEREVDSFLRKTNIKPSLAITDSQIFTQADASIPDDIPLTSFSVLLAKLKGDFENYLKGTPKISNLKDRDKVLLLESCTHHVSCDDIGRVKIPRWISNFTGKKLEFEVVAGLDEIPNPIQEYSLVIQCGGCMITQKQLVSRLSPAIEAGIAVTNYGMAIAYVQGIYQRAIAPFLTKEQQVDSGYL